ncbi:MAG TPA: hypothetical protein VK154_06020 [Chitinophagales bacterium]|nr:hypothetical protein [Chitinophagales bacterium]
MYFAKPDFVIDWDNWFLPWMLFSVASLIFLSAATKAYQTKKMAAFAMAYLLFLAAYGAFVIIGASAYPFHHEKITHAIIIDRLEYKNRKGRIYKYTQYHYYVDTVEYKGDFPENDEDIMWRYGPGDTIDITYNKEDPRKSVTTYSQYWYINPEKEKYWLKVRAGEGRRSSRLGL